MLLKRVTFGRSARYSILYKGDPNPDPDLGALEKTDSMPKFTVRVKNSD